MTRRASSPAAASKPRTKESTGTHPTLKASRSLPSVPASTARDVEKQGWLSQVLVQVGPVRAPVPQTHTQDDVEEEEQPTTRFMRSQEPPTNHWVGPSRASRSETSGSATEDTQVEPLRKTGGSAS